MTSSQEESTIISPFFFNHYFFILYIFMISCIVHISQERNIVKYPKRIANSERDFASSTIIVFLAT